MQSLRIDAFWFTVMHEFMHIKNMDSYSVDVNLVIDSEHGITIAVSDDAAEQRANMHSRAVKLDHYPGVGRTMRMAPLGPVVTRSMR